MNTDPELAVNYILNPPISEFTRTVRPRVATRKSKPSAMLVILVFSGDSMRPRIAMKSSIMGFTWCSSNSFELPVTRKSSAYVKFLIMLRIR